MNSVLIIFVIFLLFLFIDLPVILYFNRSLYEKMFEQINQGKTQHASKTYLAGLVVYVLLSIGLYYFVIKPSFEVKEEERVMYILKNSMLFGLITYGVYDFTNMATITSFGVKEGMIDMMWGGVLCGIIGMIAYSYLKNKASIN